ncbi:MAG: transposase [Deltaproteobacteria bacterium]|nr:transposase [Deltaproteobacteria bacterium]
MNINQAYKFKLKTNSETETALGGYLGCSRFVWNKALALIKLRLENKNTEKVVSKNLTVGHRYNAQDYLPRYNELAAMLAFWKKTGECSFLNKAPSQVLQQTLKDLDQAIKDAFKSGNGKRFPKFKKKGYSETGIRFPQGFKLENNRIFLPKTGWIRFFKSRNAKGTVKSVTVKKEVDGYYISVLTEQVIEKGRWADIKNLNPIGMDAGVKKIMTLSNGAYFEPLDFSKADKKISKEQCSLDRKQHSRKKGDKTKKSKNYIKQAKKVSQAFKKKSDTKIDYLHKVSAAIAKNHGFVAVENLSVDNMTKSAKGTTDNPGRNVKAKSGLNRSILAQAWSMFYDMLEYKLLFSGGQLVRVNPSGTSQECPVCHNKHKDNRKTQETFFCISCGFTANADLVGAGNILARALPEYNFKIPQGKLRKFKPVEYSKTQGVWNEADGETRCQQQELLGNREGLPVLV